KPCSPALCHPICINSSTNMETDNIDNLLESLDNIMLMFDEKNIRQSETIMQKLEIKYSNDKEFGTAVRKCRESLEKLIISAKNNNGDQIYDDYISNLSNINDLNQLTKNNTSSILIRNALQKLPITADSDDISNIIINICNFIDKERNDTNQIINTILVLLCQINKKANDESLITAFKMIDTVLKQFCIRHRLQFDNNSYKWIMDILYEIGEYIKKLTKQLTKESLPKLNNNNTVKNITNKFENRIKIMQLENELASLRSLN
ncbi:MAG: hypothetical protein Satyrvirus1_75, partial [Satyrvirus sp.]